MPSAASVLIVDESEDSREVLRTVLLSRGMNILEARHGREGLELARRHHPRVIVLDVESSPVDSSVCIALRAESLKNQGALLLLGDADSPVPSACQAGLVPKPYHYAALIRTIEQWIPRSVPSPGDERAA